MTTASKASVRIRNLAILCLILMPISALGSRFGLWPFTIGLLLLTGSLLLSLLIQIINAIWLLRKPPAPTKSALRQASLIALPPLVLIATLLEGGSSGQPAIHNISTDIDNPPQFVAAVERRGESSNPLEYTTKIAELQVSAYPDVQTIKSDLNAVQAFDKSLQVIENIGWEIYAQAPEEGRIEAVDTTFWFGFKDDIVVRIQPVVGGSLIDLRSVSRVGQGDLGANAERIRLFIERFQES